MSFLWHNVQHATWKSSPAVIGHHGRIQPQEESSQSRRSDLRHRSDASPEHLADSTWKTRRHDLPWMWGLTRSKSSVDDSRQNIGELYRRKLKASGIRRKYQIQEWTKSWGRRMSPGTLSATTHRKLASSIVLELGQKFLKNRERAQSWSRFTQVLKASQNIVVDWWDWFIIDGILSGLFDDWARLYLSEYFWEAIDRMNASWIIWTDHKLKLSLLKRQGSSFFTFPGQII